MSPNQQFEACHAPRYKFLNKLFVGQLFHAGIIAPLGPGITTSPVLPFEHYRCILQRSGSGGFITLAEDAKKSL